MILISHRGNLNGRIPELENNPSYIQDALSLGYDVELDVWVVDGGIYLGHDSPTYQIEENFLSRGNFWCHAKNLDALFWMATSGVYRYFWHEKDKFTLTSANEIWTFPNNNVCEKSIIVDNDRDWKIKEYRCMGICSDYINN